MLRDRLRGCEGGDCGWEIPVEESLAAWKQGNTAESHVGDGAITLAPLSPHASMAAEQ